MPVNIIKAGYRCEGSARHRASLSELLLIGCIALTQASCGGGGDSASAAGSPASVYGVASGDSFAASENASAEGPSASNAAQPQFVIGTIFYGGSASTENAASPLTANVQESLQPQVASSALTQTTLPANVKDSLQAIASGLTKPSNNNIFHEQGFLNTGNSLAVFKRRNPQWFNGSIQQTAVSLNSCEATERDSSVVNNKDFGLLGQVCTIKIDYRVNPASSWQTWQTKILFESNGLSTAQAKIIGNRQPSTYVTGLNQLIIETFDSNGVSRIAQESLDKDNYVKARFVFTGAEGVDSWTVEGGNANSTHGIKGRGNTSWEYPKKSYRIKFTQVVDTNGKRDEAKESRSPAGLSPSRDWVLLSQWREEDLMVTPAAQMASRLMGNKTVTSAIPVEVTWNGAYRGVYLLTEAVGSGTGRVEIDTSKSPASGGDYILELDRTYDQPGEQFRSTMFNGSSDDPIPGMPVMIKEAKSSTSAQTLSAIQGHFLKLEQALDNMMKAPISNKESAITAVGNILDYTTAGQYIAATLAMYNPEINNPKSVYMYYKAGKYYMGPLWDFDWTLYVDETFRPSLTMFQIMYSHREVKKSFCKSIAQFQANFSVFEDFVDDYSNSLQYAYLRDSQIWNNVEDRVKGYSETRPIPTRVRPASIKDQLDLLKNSYRNRANKLMLEECSNPN